MTTPMFHRAIAITNRRRPVHNAIPTGGKNVFTPPVTPCPPPAVSLSRSIPVVARRHRSPRRAPSHCKHVMPGPVDAVRPPGLRHTVEKDRCAHPVLP